MRAETALDEIKSLARVFVMLDVQLTQFSPLVIKHPFADCGIIAYKDESGKLVQADITKDTDALNKWRNCVIEQIDRAKSAHDIAHMISNPYKFAFLKYALPHLSCKDFSEMLGYMWLQTESPNSDPNLSKSKLLSMFKQAQPQYIMEKVELEQLSKLDDSVTVYRGVTPHNAKNIKALSWTLNCDTAVWFARRYDENGTVYEAKIDRKHIYAYFSRRNESEVIVDPKYLSDIHAKNM